MSLSLITGQCNTQTVDCRLQTRGRMQTEGKMQTANQGYNVHVDCKLFNKIVLLFLSLRANCKQANWSIIQVNLGDTQADQSDTRANWNAIPANWSADFHSN